MTDNEIIKALEICGNNGDCRDCPYDKTGCEFELDALDLINRQKAELQRYAQEQHDLMIEKDELFDIAEKQKALIEKYASALRVSNDAMKKVIEVENKLKAEIERLQKEVALLVENQSIPNGAEYEDWFTMPQLKSAEEVKAEAIKEFAERLIRNVTLNNTNDGYLDYAVDYNCLIEDINDLVKEMVGDVQ